MIEQNIDYESNRQRLKEFFQGNPKYKDYNFEASGLSTLINVLAYNTHYLGLYAHMLNNESSIDSAQLQQTVFSKARGLGYLPKGKRASRVEVVIKQEVDIFPERGYLVMTRFKGISGKSIRDADSRLFGNPDDVFLYDYELTPNGKYLFSSKPTVLLEGVYRDWKFKVDTSVQYQKFVIKDKTIDIDSLRVFVKKSINDTGIMYTHAQNVFETTSASRVFYVTTTHEGYYEIFFGNNVFGHQPESDSFIVCEYLSTTGEQGNGCNIFSLAGFIIEPNETSNSGSDGETLETIKFNAVNHFRQQNRIFEEADFHSAILSRFRNVQAINVWGGEDNAIKTYGKVFVSVKPYHADVLSSSAKDDIRNYLLKRRKRLGADIVFVDAEFIDCHVDIVLDTDIDKTSNSIDEVETAAIDAAQEYNKEALNVFDNVLSDVKLNDRIVKSHSAINSSYTRKTLHKSVRIDLASSSRANIYFGNQIAKGSVKANLVLGIYNFSITDSDGKIIATAVVNGKTFEYNIGAIDYATGLITFKVPLQGYTGKRDLSFTVTPANPDVKSALNNIVRITRTRVVNG